MQVDIFELEKHKKGFWGHADPAERRKLGTVLRWVGAFGYECFFQTSGDKNLVPASGACWLDAFDETAWSNLLCAHDARVLTFLRENWAPTHAELAATVRQIQEAKLVPNHLKRAKGEAAATGP